MNINGETKTATRILNDLSTEITDLNCSIQQMVAVACSFSGEYVDCTDHQLEMMVRGDIDGYRNLFNAFCTLMAIVRDKANELDDMAAKLADDVRDAEQKVAQYQDLFVKV